MTATTPAPRAIAAWRALFPITQRYAYLNHAGVGPLPTRSVAALEAFVRRQAEYGSEAWPNAAETVERIRARTAAFIGATPDEVAFCKHTSEGISFVAAGLDWRPGDNVVLSEYEFPSNAIPWLNVRDRGVEVRFVPARPGGLTPAEDLIAAIDGRTRVVAVSWVMFCTGYRVELAALAEAAHARGAWLVVDSMQGLGGIPFAARDWGVDAMASGGAKWLLGPPGVGIFYVRPELAERLRLHEAGPWTVPHRPSWLDRTFDPHPNARRFESSFVNLLGLVGLEVALDLLDEVGRDAVWARILALTDRLIAGLDARGYQLFGPRDAAHRSGIVCFRHPARRPEEVEAALRAAGVVVVVREGSVRASPHFYNDETDIDRLLDALPPV